MKEVNQTELNGLKNENTPILLDMYATWCGPCKILMPNLEKLETEYPNVTFVKMDVDKNMQQALDFGVRSVPTVLILKGNEIIDKSTGIRVETYYKEKLDSLIS